VGEAFRRTAAASLPSALRVLRGMLFRVSFFFAAACAFFTLRLAAVRCLVVAMTSGYPFPGAAYPPSPLVASRAAIPQMRSP
jgi:hypothetical protein